MNRAFAVASLALLSTSALPNQGFIEYPTREFVASGVAAISGWHCTSRNIEIVITPRVSGVAPVTASVRPAAGTERPDTAGVCGRNDTGYSLLFNFNNLTPGVYTVTGYADGLPFARHDFIAHNFGTEFLTGRNRTQRVVRNFPDADRHAVVVWNEEVQNFVVRPSPGFHSRIQGTYFGAVGEQCSFQPLPGGSISNPRFASFDVRFVPDVTLEATVRFADGQTCSISGTPRLDENGYVLAHPANTDCAGVPPSGATLATDGKNIRGWLGLDRNNDCRSLRFVGVTAHPRE